MRSYSRLLLSLLVLSGCQGSLSFDRETWLANPGVSDTDNPRARMVQAVMQHQLRAGMPRDSVVALLGKPYKEGVERRLHTGETVPDSISISTPENLKLKNQAQVLARFNAYWRQHAHPDTMLLYPVGWSIIDPNFLAIRLTGRGRVHSFWVEEH